MSEQFNPGKTIKKDKANLVLLMESLEDKNLDPEMIPIMKKFIPLPITPVQSCYGHHDKETVMHLSYVDDDTDDEKEKNFQKSFREKLKELTVSINKKINDTIVKVTYDEDDYGGKHQLCNIVFKIIEPKKFRENDTEYRQIIWNEFSNYVDKPSSLLD